MQRSSYQIAIVGSSGRGKTYSFRNVDQKTTGFINMENKPLPFIANFEHYSTPSNWQEAYNKLIEFAKNDKIKLVVFDSFSAYIDSVLRTSRETKKGFDVWNSYNEHIGQILNIIKRYPKDLIVTAHSELVETEEGIAEKRISTKGKEWKGLVEKEFTIVNYAGLKVEGDKREYILELNSDGTTSAKTPPFLVEQLGKNKIPNDVQIVIEALDKAFDKK